jgi:hypothetical protein
MVFTPARAFSFSFLFERFFCSRNAALDRPDGK